MTVEEVPVPFPKDICWGERGVSFEEQEKSWSGGRDHPLTHGNAQETNDDLNRSEGEEDLSNAAVHEPLVGLERQGEAEEVFKDDETCEALNGKVSCGIVSKKPISGEARSCLGIGEQKWEGKNLRYASTIYNELATAPMTVPATSKPKNIMGTTHFQVPRSGNLLDRPETQRN
jgi:hypothetical protein